MEADWKCGDGQAGPEPPPGPELDALSDVSARALGAARAALAPNERQLRQVLLAVRVCTEETSIATQPARRERLQGAG